MRENDHEVVEAHVTGRNPEVIHGSHRQLFDLAAQFVGEITDPAAEEWRDLGLMAGGNLKTPEEAVEEIEDALSSFGLIAVFYHPDAAALRTDDLEGRKGQE